METADDDVLTRLEISTRDARRLQLETLQSILQHNSDTDYLKTYLRDPEIGADSFRRLVPLSSYADYADLIGLIADGIKPPSSLSSNPLLCFFLSSGTSSSKPKLVPFFDSQLAKTSSNLAHQASSALLRRLFPPRPSISKILWFLYAGNVTETKGGFKVMAATAYPLQGKGPNPSPLLNICVSPQEVILGDDIYQQTYCHLLCGLRFSSSIDAIRAPYAAGLVRAIRLLESNWEQLCHDVEFGSVSSKITESPMREIVEKLLGGPQLDLAQRTQVACQKESWCGILRELWPEMRYIACVTTGSMEQYYPILKYYAGETVPLLCGDYFASECPVGINLERTCSPENTSFVLLPTAAYFEFLPFDIETSPYDKKETVDISSVEVGNLYEVVVTTYRGLYRYRLGDVVKVVGFYNSSPRIKFVTRARRDSSEIITERDLMSAMENIQLMLRDECSGEIVEFAGCLDSDSSKRHANIFVEVSSDCVLLQKKRLEESIAFLRRCCSSLEEYLGIVYKLKRSNGDLAPVEIAIVNPGSFERLLKMAVENGVSANQYKPPKIIRNYEIVKTLKACIAVKANSEAALLH
ncbi:probable indole-3-acetic acid-amido synthetase GH3.6 [Typha angustifolia]|uniref:probable indole-3-acetic acid-amido synthetase GH3.6 n=1 Tax=Typha angustifolia TaxID=59011 RepID=UPI003C2B681E